MVSVLQTLGGGRGSLQSSSLHINASPCTSMLERSAQHSNALPCLHRCHKTSPSHLTANTAAHGTKFHFQGAPDGLHGAGHLQTGTEAQPSSYCRASPAHTAPSALSHGCTLMHPGPQPTQSPLLQQLWVSFPVLSCHSFPQTQVVLNNVSSPLWPPF